LYNIIVGTEGGRLRNIVGNPVQGADFFGREKEVRRMERESRSQHLLLLAPRRVGKTSLLHEIVGRANGGADARAVFVSVAKVQDEIGFVKGLAAEICKIDKAAPLKARVRRRGWGLFGRKVESLRTPLFEVSMREWAEDDWQTIGERLIEGVRALPGHWNLCVDELPLFVLKLIKLDPSAERARSFLHWFRDLRQLPPGGRDSVHWILAGSIGLDAIARRHRLSDAINDLQCESLGPFSEQTAQAFLTELARTYELALDRGGRDRICELAEWLIPYHLQVLFKSVRGYCEDQGIDPSRNAVDEAFEALLSPTQRNYFDWWDERLTEELGSPHDGWIRDLLTACARDPRGCEEATLRQVLAGHVSDAAARTKELRWLVEVMENDGYVVRQGGRYRFRSSLLRRYWAERFS
jgi:uncharacterized protein